MSGSRRAKVAVRKVGLGSGVTVFRGDDVALGLRVVSGSNGAKVVSGSSGAKMAAGKVGLGKGVAMCTGANVAMGLRVVPGSTGPNVAAATVGVETGVAVSTEGNVELGLRVVPGSSGVNVGGRKGWVGISRHRVFWWHCNTRAEGRARRDRGEHDKRKSYQASWCLWGETHRWGCRSYLLVMEEKLKPPRSGKKQGPRNRRWLTWRWGCA